MKTSFSLENLQCTSCVSAINKALLKINGVYGIEADIANQSIKIDHTEQVDLDIIRSQLNNLGYPEKTNKDNFSDKAEEWDLNPIRLLQAEKFFKKIAEIIPLKKEDKLMDFGCGTGLVGLHFAPYVNKLVMADNSPGMLSVLQNKISKLNIDASKIELFGGEIQDLKMTDISIIVSLMTFHHLENLETTIHQLYQKLKPGGYLAIGDLEKEDGSFHNEAVPHKGFDTQQLCTLLEEHAFRSIKCETFNSIKKETEMGEKEFNQFIIIVKK